MITGVLYEIKRSLIFHIGWRSFATIVSGRQVFFTESNAEGKICMRTGEVCLGISCKDANVLRPFRALLFCLL